MAHAPRRTSFRRGEHDSKTEIPLMHGALILGWDSCVVREHKSVITGTPSSYFPLPYLYEIGQNNNMAIIIFVPISPPLKWSGIQVLSKCNYLLVDVSISNPIPKSKSENGVLRLITLNLVKYTSSH